MTELVKTRKNSSNEELKPCPFCGKRSSCEARYVFGAPYPWAVFCRRCGTWGPHGATERDAIKKWNKRASKKAVLKPCFFCGGMAHMYFQDVWIVECTSCGVSCKGPRIDGPIESWNSMRRVTE